MFNIFKKKKRKTTSVHYVTQKDFPEFLFNGYQRLTDSPEFSAGINLISDLISNMTIQVLQNTETGDKRIRNNLSRVLDIEPNEFMTRKSFIDLVVRDLLVEGNQVTIPIYNDKRELVALEPIEAKRIGFETDVVNDTYQIILDNEVILKPEEVLHFKINPKENDIFVGQGYTATLREILENLGQANKTRKAFMTSKYQPSLVISVASDNEAFASKEGRKKILGDYIQTTEAGEPFIIPSSMMNVEKIKPLTLKDIAINESMEIDKRTVASALGIPAFLLGVGEYNQDEYNNFINTKIMSLAMLLEQEMTKKLVIRDDMYIKFNNRSLLAYSIEDKVNLVQNMVALGLMNGDEARDLLNYDPIGQKEFTMLENYIPKDKLGLQKKLSDSK